MTAEVQEGRLDELASASFPMDSLNEALLHLRRPFAPAAVRWKVQAARQGYGTVIAYIDARLVIERLNLVVGGDWSDDYRAYAQGVEECALSVFGVTRRDVGTAGGFEAAKSGRSDSLKRAAVKFNIGISVYALKSVELKATPEWEPSPPRLLIANKKNEKGGRWSARLSTLAEEWLAERYGAWLEARGERLFGPVLEHGDEQGSAGMEAAEGAAPTPGEVEAAEGEAGPQLEDDRAEELRNRIRSAYGKIRKLDGARIPPAHNRVDMLEAGTSHEALEELAIKREQLLAEMQAAAS